MIDHLIAYLRHPVYIAFARPVIPALDHVKEEAVNTVAVVLIILGRVDAALGCN